MTVLWEESRFGLADAPSSELGGSVAVDKYVECPDKWRAIMLICQSGGWWFRLEKMAGQLTN
mgnify:FL=1